MQSLSEQYRPSDYSEVVGQDKAIKQLRMLEKRGLGGRTICFVGNSGTGKTTLAHIAARQLASEWSIEEYDAGNLTVNRLQELEKSVSHLRLDGGAVVIINEAHTMSKQAFTQLLVTMERIPNHVLWCFTTTIEGRERIEKIGHDGNAWLSRCNIIRLAESGLSDEFAMRAYEIAEREELGGMDLTAFRELVESCGNNFRAVLAEIEIGAMYAEPIPVQPTIPVQRKKQYENSESAYQWDCL